ncbi:MAG: hypothetical protein ACLRIT_03510 [Blautia sp.]
MLPASVRHIDARAFYQCPAVKVIRINSTALNYVGKKSFCGQQNRNYQTS